MHPFLIFILGMKLYVFRTVPLSINRTFSLYTQQWYMSYRFADSLRARSEWNAVPSWYCSQAVSKPVWHIPLLCVQWKSPDDGQRNCPKHVEFHSKNKFEKLMYLVGFIIRSLLPVAFDRSQSENDRTHSTYVSGVNNYLVPTYWLEWWWWWWRWLSQRVWTGHRVTPRVWGIVKHWRFEFGGILGYLGPETASSYVLRGLLQPFHEKSVKTWIT
jgi:hypothetical protein